MSFHALAPYVQRYPEKKAAREAVAAALRAGTLVRGPCRVCGSDSVHGHHPDYARPLEVVWLCPLHHAEWHRENGPGLNGGESPEKPGGGYDLTGRRFGKLTVVRELKTRDRLGVRWICNCDCGAVCSRSTTRLRWFGASGQHVPQCRRCSAKPGRRAQHLRRVARIADLYGRHGTLYGVAWVPREEQSIRDAISDALGVAVEYDVLADLRGVSSRGFEDYDGHETDIDGPLEGVATLEELGKAAGVTRERIRQIEGIAIQKLQRAAKSRLVVDGTPLPNRVVPVVAPPIPITRKSRPKIEKPQRVDLIAARIASLEAEIAALRAQQGAA